jgi:hypothetical protein
VSLSVFQIAKLQNYSITKSHMSFMDYIKFLKSPELRLAWAIAMAADAIQIAGLPLFVEGAISPADSLLDLVVAFLLIRLVGWHWAFLPTLAAELLPGVDLFPTWTAAVWYVTRQQIRAGEPEILPPGPAPAPRR